MKNKTDTEKKNEAIVRLRNHGYSIREIMRFCNYNSPRAIQKVLDKFKTE